MRTAEQRRRAAADARKLAATPVANPYRGALSDPFLDQPALGPERPGGPLPGPGQPPDALQYDSHGQPVMPRRRAPGLAIASGIMGLTLGIIVGILGLLIIALVNLVHNLDVGDRSFEAGTDASWVLLGVLDFAVCAALVIGSVALLLGKLAGRIAVTAGAWTTVAFSEYWWRQTSVPPAFPVIIGLAAVLILGFSYHRSVTRWLGVVPPPQPD